MKLKYLNLFYTNSQPKLVPSFKILLFVLFTGTTFLTTAQDHVYFKDGNYISVWVQNIKGSKLYYKFNQDVTSVKFNKPIDDISLIVYENGTSYILEEEYEIKNPASFTDDFDVILPTVGKPIIANVNNSVSKQIYYYNPGTYELKKLNRDSVVAVFYKSGTYTFFKEYTEVIESLKSFFPKGTDVNAVVNWNRKAVESTNADSSSDSTKDSNQNSNDGQETPTVAANDEPSLVDFAAEEINIEGEENPLSFEEFREKALQKTKDLSEYIALISNRSTDKLTSNKLINLSVDLFVDEKATVEVSKLTQEKITVNKYPIRTYLNRLKLLKYDNVEVTWADINYVSDFREGVDGNFYATISLKQTFKGITDGNVVYTDITEKSLEVVVKKLIKESQGKKTSYWDILLSDIGVKSTRG